MSLQAAPGDDFAFDLYVENDQIVVWVDLSQLVKQTEIDQLLDGSNLSFEIDFKLDRPKRLFGDHTVAQNNQSLVISYNLITETFTIRFSEDNYQYPTALVGVTELQNFLTDSLSFKIAPYKDLEPDQQYVLKIRAIRLSMSEPIRVGEHKDDLGEETLLKAVFRHFLNWTEFGRQEFQSESRPLAASELID